MDRISLLMLFVCLALLPLSPSARADKPIELEWINQFGTNGEESNHSVAVDRSGNVYISGQTSGNLGGDNAGRTDAYLAKLSPSGDRLWVQQFGGAYDDWAADVAVDDAGSVYVSGHDVVDVQTGSQAFVTKYDSDGAEVWSLRTDAGHSAASNSVAVDGFGNVYISGRRSDQVLNRNAFVTKYDPTGGELWTRQFDASQDDLAFSVAVDQAGNAYITGATWGDLAGTNAGIEDAFVAKLNPDGEELWTRQIGTSDWDKSYDVAVDHRGNAYISGRTQGSLAGVNAGSWDAFIVKYDPAGTELWSRQIGTSSADSSYAVTVDEAGAVYISGDTDGGLGGANSGGSDVFFSKFSPDGAHLWTQQFGSSDDDSSLGIDLDSAGNVYITGGTMGSLDGPALGGSDAYVAKFRNLAPEPASAILLLSSAGLLGVRQRCD